MRKTNMLLLSGLFSALTAICSWINIPLFFTPVPINLALIGPYMSGLMLGPRYGLLSQLIYILLGAIGVPVFAGFSGGIGVLAGPTGGFIAGYAVCAFICGLSMPVYRRKSGAKAGYGLSRENGAYPADATGRSPMKLGMTAGSVGFMLLGLTACYIFGLIWYMALTGAGLWSGLVACVLPFLPGDAFKITAAAILYRQLARAVNI